MRSPSAKSTSRTRSTAGAKSPYPSLGRPENLQAMVSEAGAVLLECDPVPGATIYLWKIQIPGRAGRASRSLQTKKPFTWINALQPEPAVEVTIQARSAKGVSSPSEPLLIRFPMRTSRTS